MRMGRVGDRKNSVGIVCQRRCRRRMGLLTQHARVLFLFFRGICPSEILFSPTRDEGK